MTALLDFTEQTLDYICGANEFPVFFWKAIKGQASLPIALQAGDGRRIDGGVLFNEGRGTLIGFRPALLIEDGFEFRADRFLLLFGNIAQNVFDLVLDATLALRTGELVACHK